MSCCDTHQNSARSAHPGWFSSPHGFWLLAVVAIAGGLVLGWEKLVLLGIAPILVSLLPCLLMCGLGLCMMKCKGKNASPTDQPANVDAPKSAEGARTIIKETA